MTIKNNLPISIAEEQGLSSLCILEFLKEIEKKQIELHGFVLLRHGNLITNAYWNPYKKDTPHMIFSISKSFTSTAIGIAISEGLLSIDDKVISFFPEISLKNCTEFLETMTIKHLLTMTSGHDCELHKLFFNQNNWIDVFFNTQLKYKPGTHFVYNSGATYILSVIIQKITNQTLLDYLKPRLLEPIGIYNATWEVCPEGYNTGGWGLNVTTEDIARLGQLYLQNGYWNGKQIISKDWIIESTKCHMSTESKLTVDSKQGYGYQIWRARNNCYQFRGMFGQLCLIMPDKDAIISITSATDNAQDILDLIWKHIYNNMKDNPLPLNHTSIKLLNKKISSLNLLPKQNTINSKLIELINNKNYKILNDDNVSFILFNFNKNKCELTINKNNQSFILNCGIGEWITQKTSYFFNNEYNIAININCIDHNILIITFYFLETPFMLYSNCIFEKDKINIEFSINVNKFPFLPQSIKGQVLSN